MTCVENHPTPKYFDHYARGMTKHLFLLMAAIRYNDIIDWEPIGCIVAKGSTHEMMIVNYETINTL